MKKIIYFLAFLCITGQFFGQQLFDFEKSHWYVVKTNWNADEFKATSQEVFQTSSKIGKIDTTGFIYYKLNTSLSFKLKGKDQKQFFIRQDSTTGKVFIRSFMDETEEFLLYDFNLKVGDTFKSVLANQLKEDLIVTKVENVGTVDDPIRMIETRLNGSGNLYKFTEGIGSLNGFIVNLPMDVMKGSVLKCYHKNNELVYSQGDDCPATPKLKPRPVRKK